MPPDADARRCNQRSALGLLQNEKGMCALDLALEKWPLNTDLHALLFGDRLMASPRVPDRSLPPRGADHCGE